MKRLLLSALAAGTFLTGGLAIAADAPPPPPPPHGGHHDLFGEMDLNKDGVVTRAEVTQALDKRFAELDTDHNGVITEAERQAARERVRTERFNARFDAMDTDHNGQLSREELRAAHERRPGGPDARMADGAGGPPPPPPGGEPGDRRGPGGADGHGPGGPGGPGGHRGPEGHDGPPRFGGRPGGMHPQGDVTKAQFSARPLQLFDVIDSNHDGKITVAERDAALALVRPWHRDGDAPGPDAPARK